MRGVRTLALDADGDLAVANGQLTLVDGADAVRQALQLRLSIWQGEWFADTTVGVPYLRFLGIPGALPLAESLLRRAISTCPGVATLDRFSLTLDARRRAVVSFAVTAITGEPVEVSDFIAGDA